jgi:hypothetical protein
VLDRPRRDVAGRPCLALPPNSIFPALGGLGRGLFYARTASPVRGRPSLPYPTPPVPPTHAVACLRGFSVVVLTLAYPLREGDFER